MPLSDTSREHSRLQTYVMLPTACDAQGNKDEDLEESTAESLRVTALPPKSETSDSKTYSRSSSHSPMHTAETRIISGHISFCNHEDFSTSFVDVIKDWGFKEEQLEQQRLLLGVLSYSFYCSASAGHRQWDIYFLILSRENTQLLFSSLRQLAFTAIILRDKQIHYLEGRNRIWHLPNKCQI